MFSFCTFKYDELGLNGNFLVLPETLIAIECKAGLSPTLSRGSYKAIDDLRPLHTFIVAPVARGYPHSKGIDVVNLDELTGRLAELLAK